MYLIKKYNCSQCNYASDRKWTIKDHERRVHNTVNKHGTNQPTQHTEPSGETVQCNNMIEAVDVWKIYKLLQRMKNK